MLDQGQIKEIVMQEVLKHFQGKPCGQEIGDSGKLEVPAEISARHVHLNKDDLEALFGKGHQLTEFKALSQPGQYAAKEQVNLIGPKSTINNVRVLGPLRSKTQIEVSRTDAIKLGIDAPLRESGKIEGSAPIVLQGPKGVLSLKEGTIVAMRHLHMTTAEALKFGVKDGELVKIRFGGERALVFEQVLVRVRDDYHLAFHLDTDEANAGSVFCQIYGEVIK